MLACGEGGQHDQTEERIHPWQWRWNADVVLKVTLETSRMVRLPLHLRKQEGQSWVERRIESMRRARDPVLGVYRAM